MSNVTINCIAAAAAHGFAEAYIQKAPRSAAAWVEHCRAAARAAYERLQADPPPSEPDAGVKTLRNIVRRMEQIDPEPGFVPTSYDDDRISGEALDRACKAAAAAAFRGTMPLLVSKQAVRFYIATVAAGTQDGHLTSGEGKSLLYSAQLALAAYKSTTRAPRARVKHDGPRLVRAGSTGTHGPTPG